MWPMRHEHILAVDVGGSSLRAGLVRSDGTIVSTAAVALAALEPRAGWSELDPDVWWHLRTGRGRTEPSVNECCN